MIHAPTRKSKTQHKRAGDESEVYCELVKGLGESLVSGTVPGSALSFSAPKADLASPQILTFPSKSHGMFVPESLIFRSDSNGEDLAGARCRRVRWSVSFWLCALACLVPVAPRPRDCAESPFIRQPLPVSCQSPGREPHITIPAQSRHRAPVLAM